MNVRSGAGKKLILNAYAMRDGLVPGSVQLFEGVLNTGDYHNEMNSAHYAVSWF